MKSCNPAQLGSHVKRDFSSKLTAACKWCLVAVVCSFGQCTLATFFFSSSSLVTHLSIFEDLELRKVIRSAFTMCKEVYKV